MIMKYSALLIALSACLSQAFVVTPPAFRVKTPLAMETDFDGTWVILIRVLNYMAREHSINPHLLLFQLPPTAP
jgi:hypothetical protein